VGHHIGHGGAIAQVQMPVVGAGDDEFVHARIVARPALGSAWCPDDRA
jgi:hypothetical protein